VKIDLMKSLRDDKEGRKIERVLERQIALRLKLLDCLSEANKAKRRSGFKEGVPRS
jgi:hypothetical protein